jgi:hypothetical protein
MGRRITPKNISRSGIDPETRDRIRQLKDPFFEALDRAIDEPTDDHHAELRIATDELMRALARILIEIREEDGRS